jgi:outer membrane lipoprotein SlyB
VPGASLANNQPIEEHFMKQLSVLVLIGASAFAFAQQKPVVYPSKGQSAQQQQNDEGACYSWAKQNTGIDPATVANAAPPPAQAQSGQRVRGAAAGAAMGAAAGAIGGDAGHGAAVGAVAGTMAGGVAHRQQARAANAQNAQVQQSQQQALATYNHAWSTCMTGRGYTVQ